MPAPGWDAKAGTNLRERFDAIIEEMNVALTRGDASDLSWGDRASLVMLADAVVRIARDLDVDDSPECSESTAQQLRAAARLGARVLQEQRLFAAAARRSPT